MLYSGLLTNIHNYIADYQCKIQVIVTLSNNKETNFFLSVFVLIFFSCFNKITIRIFKIRVKINLSDTNVDKNLRFLYLRDKELKSY